MTNKKYLITTAIDYVNDVIHIGHAYQKVLADALARYQRCLGNEVFFLTGTDEHGSKTEQEARKRGISSQEVANKISAQDKKQLDALHLSYNRFIRTTDSDHRETVTRFYQRSYENGDIYLGRYTGIYCVGCEEFLKEKDLVAGKCPNHPHEKPKILTEKNYFFRWRRYESFLRNHIRDHPEFVQPKSRRSEMLSFLETGLSDIPISRPNVKFGIPVPNDPQHVIYVWFDALINYITGAPQFWQEEKTVIIHVLGKDNVRWHALLWPAMLKSAGYRLPNIVYGHDFLTLNGQKISKSLGNIIRPAELTETFGAEAVRYFLLRYGPLRNDSDLTASRIKDAYNTDLANGLGNLIARVARLCEKSGFHFPATLPAFRQLYGTKTQTGKHWAAFRVDLILSGFWERIKRLDRQIDQSRPWEQKGEKLRQNLTELVASIRKLSSGLSPFLPETAQRIKKQFRGPRIVSSPPLFPRK